MNLLDDAELAELRVALRNMPSGPLAHEELESAAQLVRLTLQGALEREWTFEQAWKAAMARLQPSQAGGSIDEAGAASLREDRRLLEEDKPWFQAIYEGREPTMLERAQRLAATTARLDADEATHRAVEKIRSAPSTVVAAPAVAA